jgi:hypothetical protein
MKKLFEWRSAIASEAGPRSAITRLVLFILSLPMAADGSNCFLSVRKVAIMSGLSLQTVVTHIKIAVKEGWLIKKRKGFSGQGWRHNEYLPAIPKGVQRGGTPYNVEGGQADGTRKAEGVQSDIHKVFKDVEPNTINNSIRKNNSIRGDASVPSTPAEALPLPQVKKKKSTARKGRATPLPNDFTLTPVMREFAVNKGIADSEGLFERFCDHWRGNGKKWVDWVAVWRNWVRREIKFEKERAHGKPNQYRKHSGGISEREGEELKKKYAGFSKEPAA